MATLDHRYNARAYALLLRMIYARPYTAHDLVEETGLSYNTVLKFLRSLHDQELVKKAGWEIDAAGHRTIVLWKWAPFKPDAVFEKKTHSEMCKTSRANTLARWNAANPHMKFDSYWRLLAYKKKVKEAYESKA